MHLSDPVHTVLYQMDILWVWLPASYERESIHNRITLFEHMTSNHITTKHQLLWNTLSLISFLKTEIRLQLDGSSKSAGVRPGFAFYEALTLLPGTPSLLLCSQRAVFWFIKKFWTTSMNTPSRWKGKPQAEAVMSQEIGSSVQHVLWELPSWGHPSPCLPSSWATPSHPCPAWWPRGSCPTVHTAKRRSRLLNLVTLLKHYAHINSWIGVVIVTLTATKHNMLPNINTMELTI